MKILTDYVTKFSAVYTPPIDSISALIYKGDVVGLQEKLALDKSLSNSLDNKGPTSSWSPLYWAIKLEKIDCAKILLDNDADVDVVVYDDAECLGSVLDLAVIRKEKARSREVRKFYDDLLQILRMKSNVGTDIPADGVYHSMRQRNPGAQPPSINFERRRRGRRLKNQLWETVR